MYLTPSLFYLIFFSNNSYLVTLYYRSDKKTAIFITYEMKNPQHTCPNTSTRSYLGVLMEGYRLSEFRLYPGGQKFRSLWAICEITHLGILKGTDKNKT